MKSAIPILRIFDETKAREHYVAFLGFKIDWEHRFEENSPVFIQISKGACVINLSEHHGDACPGAALRIETDELEEFCAELRTKNFKYSKPGRPEKTDWGTQEITIVDPFGNRLIFYSRTVL